VSTESLAQSNVVATLGGMRMNVHDHVCAFYRSKANRDRIMVPFLREGMRQGQMSYGLTVHAEHRRIESEVEPADPRLLELIDPRDSYFRGGDFTSQRMLAYWDELGVRTFETRGLGFARIIADMIWARPLISKPFVDDLIAYEFKFNQWSRRYPNVTVCMYDLDRFGGDVLIPAMKVHPRLWVNGVVVENPYYLQWGQMLQAEG
jgi:hypothetical protein